MVSAACRGRMPSAVSRAKVAATCSTGGKSRCGNAPECATSSHTTPTTRKGTAVASARAAALRMEARAGAAGVESTIADNA
jgi:hypothetical protein